MLADCLRFILTFRNQLPKEAYAVLFPVLNVLLSSQVRVVGFYVCMCVCSVTCIRCTQRILARTAGFKYASPSAHNTHTKPRYSAVLDHTNSACTRQVHSQNIQMHNLTTSTYAQDCIVHTYAACCVERMLTTKDGNNLRVSKADVQPMLQPLLVSLFGCLNHEASKENPHIMK
jgi:hypothetical protein